MVTAEEKDGSVLMLHSESSRDSQEGMLLLFLSSSCFLETDKWKSVKVYILRLAQLFEKPKKKKRGGRGSVKKNNNLTLSRF